MSEEEQQNQRAKEFFHNCISMFESGHRDFTIDFARKDGTAGKVRVVISEVEPIVNEDQE